MMAKVRKFITDFFQVQRKPKIDIKPNETCIQEQEYRLGNLQLILDWYLNPGVQQEEQPGALQNIPWDEAYRRAVAWHDEQYRNRSKTGIKIRDGQEVLIDYPNDTLYWLDLKTSYDAEEADNAGHCGSASTGTLFSLRDYRGNVRITADIDVSRHVAGQIYGCGNSTPAPKYHGKILDLLHKLGIKKVKPVSYGGKRSFDPNIDVSQQLKQKFIDQYDYWFNNGSTKKEIAEAIKLINEANQGGLTFYKLVGVDEWSNAVIGNFVQENNSGRIFTVVRQVTLDLRTFGLELNPEAFDSDGTLTFDALEKWKDPLVKSFHKEGADTEPFKDFKYSVVSAGGSYYMNTEVSDKGFNVPLVDWVKQQISDAKFDDKFLGAYLTSLFTELQAGKIILPNTASEFFAFLQGTKFSWLVELKNRKRKHCKLTTSFGFTEDRRLIDALLDKDYKDYPDSEYEQDERALLEHFSKWLQHNPDLIDQFLGNEGPSITAVNVKDNRIRLVIHCDVTDEDQLIKLEHKIRLLEYNHVKIEKAITKIIMSDFDTSTM